MTRPTTPPDPGYWIGVISDTHGYLPPAVFKLFEGASLILHAGDVGGDDILIDLEALAPVHAVSGNVDDIPYGRSRPNLQRIETPLGRIAMTHGHLPGTATDPEVLVRYFRDFDPAVIVYGHSHIARLTDMDGVQVFNPGSAGHARFGRQPSVGRITWDSETLAPCCEIIPL